MCPSLVSPHAAETKEEKDSPKEEATAKLQNGESKESPAPAAATAATAATAAAGAAAPSAAAAAVSEEKKKTKTRFMFNIADGGFTGTDTHTLTNLPCRVVLSLCC